MDERALGPASGAAGGARAATDDAATWRTPVGASARARAPRAGDALRAMPPAGTTPGWRRLAPWEADIRFRPGAGTLPSRARRRPDRALRRRGGLLMAGTVSRSHPPPAGAGLRPDPGAAEAFLRLLYGEAADELPGDLGLWTLSDRACVWLPAGDLGGAAAVACRLAETDNAYFHVALHDRTAAGGRGTIKSARVLPGLFAEFDVQGPAHAAGALPATLEAALAHLRETFPLPPTAVVGSGHGGHAYWLFTEPWVLADADERERAGALLWRFLGTLQERWRRRGWALDPVAELARVLRLPGTVNRKRGLPAVAVRLLEAAPERRYSPDDFEPYLLDEGYLPRARRTGAGARGGTSPPPPSSRSSPGAPSCATSATTPGSSPSPTGTPA